MALEDMADQPKDKRGFLDLCCKGVLGRTMSAQGHLGYGGSYVLLLLLVL